MVFTTTFPQVRTIPETPGVVCEAFFTPTKLMVHGANIEAEVSASISDAMLDGRGAKSATVLAHIDTGAGITSIDERLAERLGLVSTGYLPINTASGAAFQKTYLVDIAFPACGLKQIKGLDVCSARLFYSPEASMRQTNFGILIGRDILSRWHITWNGPTSTVTICD